MTRYPSMPEPSLYLAGLAVGQDIGLRLAPEVVTKEALRQQDLAAMRTPPSRLVMRSAPHSP
jgi:hypothetical protein